MTEQAGTSRASVADRAIAAALAVLAVATLARIYGAGEAAGAVAVAALLGFCGLGQRFFGLRERLLLAVALALTAAEIAVGPAPGPVIGEALTRASFLAAFMLLLGLLRDAAATSEAVAASGRYMTRQPPGRRYLALAGGSHLLTVLLNVGALNLLAPLIKAGVRAGREGGDPGWMTAIRERRQYSANLRGFATAIVWAPTTVTQAILASLFPGADPVRVMLYGLGFAVLSLLLGWGEDRLRWTRVRRRLAAEGWRPAPVGAAPLGALAGVAGVAAALVGLAMAARAVFDVALVPALMLAAPFVTLGWIAVQAGRSGAPAALSRRGRAILLRSVPGSSPEAITLAAAGYIGAMLTALVPAEVITRATEGLAPLALLALMPLLVVLAVQVALTPIVMVVFLGTAIGTLDPLPVAPDLMILALGGGWAIAMTASPFAAGALVLGRVAGLSPVALAWRWNLLYSAALYLVLVGWLAVLMRLG